MVKQRNRLRTAKLICHSTSLALSILERVEVKESPERTIEDSRKDTTPIELWDHDSKDHSFALKYKYRVFHRNRYTLGCVL